MSSSSSDYSTGFLAATGAGWAFCTGDWAFWTGDCGFWAYGALVCGAVGLAGCCGVGLAGWATIFCDCLGLTYSSSDNSSYDNS
jgi:hypothetical protein